MFTLFNEQVNWNKALEHVKGSRGLMVHIALTVAVGFVCGYAIKKYSKYLVVVILSVAVALFLQNIGVLSIVINKAHIYYLLGIDSGLVNEQFSTTLWSWILSNTAATLSFIIGFLCGVRIA